MKTKISTKALTEQQCLALIKGKCGAHEKKVATWFSMSYSIWNLYPGLAPLNYAMSIRAAISSARKCGSLDGYEKMVQYYNHCLQIIKDKPKNVNEDILLQKTLKAYMKENYDHVMGLAIKDGSWKDFCEEIVQEFEEVRPTPEFYSLYKK